MCLLTYPHRDTTEPLPSVLRIFWSEDQNPDTTQWRCAPITSTASFRRDCDLYIYGLEDNKSYASCCDANSLSLKSDDEAELKVYGPSEITDFPGHLRAEIVVNSPDEQKRRYRFTSLYDNRSTTGHVENKTQNVLAFSTESHGLIGVGPSRTHEVPEDWHIAYATGIGRGRPILYKPKSSPVIVRAGIHTSILQIGDDLELRPEEGAAAVLYRQDE